MKILSEQYKSSNIIIKGQLTPEIENAICNCFNNLKERLDRISYEYKWYVQIEQYIWTDFLYERKSNYQHNFVSTYIKDENNLWYRKLLLIESSLKALLILIDEGGIYAYRKREIYNKFVEELNYYFGKLNFAYRIVDGKIVEMESEEEIKSIETVIEKSESNISYHMQKALELLSNKPNGDYANSIKESISAVEAFCREKTGENTLGPALNELENKGLNIHKDLKAAFLKLYTYTNNEKTGIRHSLMDKTRTYVPTSNEATFMLVSCSAFINYLTRKSANINMQKNKVF